MKTFNPVFNWQYLEGHKFNIQSKTIAGDNCFLITPSKISFKDHWEEQDLIFRSSIWNDKGEPVSLSFKKFFNWGEAAYVTPPPTSIKNLSVMEKLDGSTLIFSKYKGQLIIRTRGSFSIDHLDNSSDIYFLLNKYPQLARFENTDTWTASYIFEWYSPAHKIVLNYGDEPLIWLTGIINHEDYSYWSQEELDVKAEWHSFKRPRRYMIDSFDDLLSLKPLLDTELSEGFCVYYNNDQNILKLKTSKYLAIHAFKSELSLAKMVDLFMIYDKPSYVEFIKLINAQFDYECATYAMPLARKICDAAKEVNKIIGHMREFVEELRGETRKWAAESIISSYGNTIKSGMAFKILDNKEIELSQYKKLIEQVLRG